MFDLQLLFCVLGLCFYARLGNSAVGIFISCQSILVICVI